MSDDEIHPAKAFFGLLVVAGGLGLLVAAFITSVMAVTVVYEVYGELVAGFAGLGIASAVLLTGMAGLKWFDNRG